MPAVVVGVAAGLAAATVVAPLTAIAIGLGAGILSDALSPKIPEIGADTSHQTLKTDAASRRTRIYGQAVVSGPIVKYSKERANGKEYHHFFTPLANHRCEDIRLYQLDGNPKSALAGNGYRLIPRDGTQTAALSTAVAEMSNVDSSFVGFGITDVYHKYEINTEIFPNGVTDVKFIVKGALLYDPRKDTTVGGSGSHRFDDKLTWEWSNNPALANLDWKRFGGDIELGIELFDMANIASEANICDELVTILDKNEVEVTEPRYTCDGVIDLSRGSKANELELLSSCAGRWAQSGDKYYLLTGAYRGPAVLTITDDDIKGDISREPVASLDARCNAVTSTFISKKNFYQKTDSTKVESSFYRAQKDKNRYLEHDRVYSFTQTDTMTQRLNRQYMEYVRAGDTLSMDVGVIGMSCPVGRTVTVNSVNAKITNKEYEVLHNRIDLNTKICSLTLKETAPAIHADTNIAAEQDLTPNTEIDNTLVLPPTSIQFTQDATKPTRVGFLTWQHPVDSAVEYYKVEITNTAGTEIYRPIQRPAEPYVDLFNLNVGNYVARIQAFNTFGRASTVATRSFTISAVFNSASGNFLFGQLPPEDEEGEDGQIYLTIPGGVIYLKSNGTWSIDGNLAADGDRWLSGTTDPSDSLGTNGDWYIRLPDYLTWQKIDGTWVASGTIKGASGSDGDKGDPGNNGQSVFTTYNSSVSQPGQPPTDGTGDGWTLTHNVNTRWQAQKTAININSGTWGVAAPFRGEDGNDGEDGLSAYQIWLAAGNSGNIQAFLNDLNGNDGIDGNEWFNIGSGAPSNSLGKINDFALSAGRYVYQKTGTSTWTYRYDLKGPRGDPGTPGAPGSPGADAPSANDQRDSASGTINNESWTRIMRVDIPQGVGSYSQTITINFSAYAEDVVFGTGPGGEMTIEDGVPRNVTVHIEMRSPSGAVGSSQSSYGPSQNLSNLTYSKTPANYGASTAAYYEMWMRLDVAGTYSFANLGYSASWLAERN